MGPNIKNVKLEYPRVEGRYNTIDIDLIDVRASDGIRVQYDFERDGWVISSPVWDEEGNMIIDYKESAFVQSWINSKD